MALVLLEKQILEVAVEEVQMVRRVLVRLELLLCRSSTNEIRNC
jgi:hypothetical protein